MVNFWGSWCPPCRVETPELVRSANAWRSSGPRFLRVDLRDERSAARAFPRQYGLLYPSLFDDDGTVTLSFRNVPPNAVPATFVFDRKGRIAVTAFGRVTADGLAAVLRPWSASWADTCIRPPTGGTVERTAEDAMRRTT